MKQKVKSNMKRKVKTYKKATIEDNQIIVTNDGELPITNIWRTILENVTIKCDKCGLYVTGDKVLYKDAVNIKLVDLDEDLIKSMLKPHLFTLGYSMTLDRWYAYRTVHREPYSKLFSEYSLEEK